MNLDSRRERARENAIESWMLRIVEDQGIERYDDLHIDRIDKCWDDPETWVEGGLEALRLACVLRQRNKLLCTLALGFSLKSNRQFSGMDFESQGQFIERLDSSPPSLYLFQPGEEPWVKPAAFVEELPARLFGIHSEISGCFYLEFQHEGWEEYSRSVFVTSDARAVRRRSW